MLNFCTTCFDRLSTSVREAPRDALTFPRYTHAEPPRQPDSLTQRFVPPGPSILYQSKKGRRHGPPPPNL